MERIFVDTSTLFALLATEDYLSNMAADIWDELIETQQAIITNNYALVECFTHTQSRLGLDFVRHLHSNIVPLLTIGWIDEEQHEAIVEDVHTASRLNLSLVDCSAFNTMRRLGIDTVFTFDPHFAERGFNVIPD
jgi:predicted nucleic acid-binding protein